MFGTVSNPRARYCTTEYFVMLHVANTQWHHLLRLSPTVSCGITGRYFTNWMWGLLIKFLSFRYFYSFLNASILFDIPFIFDRRHRGHLCWRLPNMNGIEKSDIWFCDNINFRSGEINERSFGSPILGAQVTKIPFVYFSVREIFYFAKVPVIFLELLLYLTGVIAAELRRHLSKMKVIFNRWPVF